MNWKALSIILLVFCALLSCEKDSGLDAVYPADSFFFTSFESPADTAGWNRIGMQNIEEDAPKVGGSYSVQISGGCVIPHAWYSFAPLIEDASFLLKCWGKNMSNGGSVSLQAENQSGYIYIPVSETEWTEYVSEDTLHCTAGCILRLELNSGGIMASAMRVDQIEITALD